MPRPGQIVCGNIDMRIDSRSQWHYQGTPIKRPELVRLFSSVLRRDDAGDYWLITPAEMCRIQVADAPFSAVELTVANEGPSQVICFRTNIDQYVTLDHDHPLRVDIDVQTDHPHPYLTLPGGLDAKLSRSVFYQLIDLGNCEDIDGEMIYGVWSCGTFFPVDRMPVTVDE